MDVRLGTKIVSAIPKFCKKFASLFILIPDIRRVLHLRDVHFGDHVGFDDGDFV